MVNARGTGKEKSRNMSFECPRIKQKVGLGRI